MAKSAAEFIDTEALRYFMEGRDMNPTVLARKAGQKDAYVRRLLRSPGKKNQREITNLNDIGAGKLAAIATALGIPVEGLVPSTKPAPSFLHGTWLKPKNIRAFTQLTRGAKRVLTIHHDLNGYLLHPEMADKIDQKFTVPQGCTPQEKTDLIKRRNQYREENIQARKKADYLHRIVASAGLFRPAQKEWVSAAVANLEEYAVKREAPVIALSLVDERRFSVLKAGIHTAISTATAFERWSMISVLDDFAAVVRFDQDYHVTYHRPTVQKLLSEVEPVLNQYVPYFPKPDCDRASIERRNTETMLCLQNLERSR